MNEKIIIDDQLINYQCYQKNGNKTLLFLHGWRSDSTIWETIVYRIKKQNVSIYALDFPGFGKSDLPRKNFNVGDYAKIINDFIIKLNLNSVTLIGHSFGGRVAIKLAAINPKLVDKLVLVDSAGFVLTNNRTKRILAKLAKPFFKPKFMQNFRRSIYRRIGSEDYVATPAMTQTYLNVIKEDLREYLPSISQDTLIIWGEEDRETPLRAANILSKGIVHSKMEVLSGAGHFCFLDQPEAFSRLLINFIH